MHAPSASRLRELLAGEAADDLSADERAELACAARGPMERNDLMRVAALAQVAFLEGEKIPPTRMPPVLEARLRAQASRWSARRTAGE
jgi:hypothetical protein